MVWPSFAFDWSRSVKSRPLNIFAENSAESDFIFSFAASTSPIARAYPPMRAVAAAVTPSPPLILLFRFDSTLIAGAAALRTLSTTSARPANATPAPSTGPAMFITGPGICDMTVVICVRRGITAVPTLTSRPSSDAVSCRCDSLYFLTASTWSSPSTSPYFSVWAMSSAMPSLPRLSIGIISAPERPKSFIA